MGELREMSKCEFERMFENYKVIFVSVSYSRIVRPRSNLLNTYLIT